MSKRVERVLFLKKEMEMQSNAIVKATNHNAVVTHTILLQRVTDEWCALQKQLTDAERLEMADIVG